MPPPVTALRRFVQRLLIAGACVMVASVIAPHRARIEAQIPSGAETAATPRAGADTILDARTNAVASRLRCPVCQGESIQDSPAELAGQMKDLVREQLASGRSEAQVYEYFTAKYGQWILLEPKAEGINLLVYWLPVAFLAIGAAGLAFAVRKWTRPVQNAPAELP